MLMIVEAHGIYTSDFALLKALFKIPCYPDFSALSVSGILGKKY